MWQRVALTVDRRLLVAAVGIAAAVTLPAAGVLVASGLAPDVASSSWLAVSQGGDLDADRVGSDGIEAAAALAVRDGQVIATVWGPDGVVLGGDAPLVPPDAVLVPLAEHPDGVVDVLLLSRATEVSGAVVVPARGGDAFEAVSLDGLRSQSVGLVAASVPVVVLVAWAFVGLEAARLRRARAVFGALGHPEVAARVLRVRGLLAVGLGGAVALVGVLAFVKLSATVSLPPGPVWLLAWAVPVAAGLATALLAPVWTARPDEALRSPGGQVEPAPRLPLPVSLRPLLLGARPALVFLLAAGLFLVDVGAPLAAASIPASIAGSGDEWVRGDAFGGGAVPAGPGDVIGLHPDVEGSVAEVLVTTVARGVPLLLRGGDGLASYHGVDGPMPGPGEVVLGRGSAGRMGVSVGDELVVPVAAEGRVGVLRVADVRALPGLLDDEGLLEGSTARQMAGLADGQATLLRVKPASAAVQELLERSDPDIQVMSVSVIPAQPAAGTVMRLQADLVNLGSQAGTRPLAFQVDGVVVAVRDAQVGAFSRTQVTVATTVPDGPFTVSVNPDAQATPSGSATRIEAPASVALGDGFTVRVVGPDGPVQGAALGLYRTLDDVGGPPEATATTDAQGEANVTAAWQEQVVLAGPDGAVAVTGVRSGPGTVQVQQVWAVPAAPRTGDPLTVYAALRNPGDATVAEGIEVFRDGRRIDVHHVELEAGGAVVVQTTFRWPAQGTQVTVGGTDLVLDPGPAQQVPAPTYRSSGSVAAEVTQRVLGDVEGTLVRLAAVAIASSLAVVYLVTERALLGRRGPAAVLAALGLDEAGLRRRAAAEAGWMAAAVFVVAFGALALLWPLLTASWAPFGHRLPNPFGWLLLLQGAAAFGGIAALAGYRAAGRLRTWA